MFEDFINCAATCDSYPPVTPIRSHAHYVMIKTIWDYSNSGWLADLFDSLIFINIFLFRLHWLDYSPPVTPIRSHAHYVMIKTIWDYSNSGWLADLFDSLIFINIFLFRLHWLDYSPPVTPIRQYACNVMIKTIRAYSNSGWLTDFGRHHALLSVVWAFKYSIRWFLETFFLWAALLSPFRHISIRFADFYRHFALGCTTATTHAACHSNPSVYIWRIDKDNRAYSNSRWLADLVNIFALSCLHSGRHTSIWFADFYQHFALGCTTATFLTLTLPLTPIRPHAHDVMIKTIWAYSNSGWLTDFGRHQTDHVNPVRN